MSKPEIVTYTWRDLVSDMQSRVPKTLNVDGSRLPMQLALMDITTGKAKNPLFLVRSLCIAPGVAGLPIARPLSLSLREMKRIFNAEVQTDDDR